MERFCFRLGFQFFRLFDHLNDAVIFAGAAGPGHTDGCSPLFHHSAGIYVSASGLRYGHRFACHGSLIHRYVTIYDTSVQRNDVAAADDDHVAFFYLGQVCQIVRTFRRAYPDSVHLEGHGTRQIAYGFLIGPIFQDLTGIQQEHNGPCRIKISCQHGSCDRCGIQNRDLQPSGSQTGNSLMKIF